MSRSDFREKKQIIKGIGSKRRKASRKKFLPDIDGTPCRKGQGMKNRAVTDWNVYYRKPFFLSKYTRSILRKRLLRAVRKYLPDRHAFDVAELGGGASCYMCAIMHNFTVRKYHIFDNNAEALQITAACAGTDYESAIVLHENDLLTEPGTEQLDCNLVFSGGLIEHFKPEDTAELVRLHFEKAATGGVVILLFPVRSLLYRITRALAELFRCWIFHDERPLTDQEVLADAQDYGELLHKETIHSIMLSQSMMVFRKKSPEAK